MYEFGNVYRLNPEATSTAEAPLAPYSEANRLGVWMTGALAPANWARQEVKATVYDLKAVIFGILSRLGISERELKLTQDSSPLMAARLTIATRSGKWLGELGIVANAVLRKMDIKQEVYFAELDWSALASLATKRAVKYSDLPKTLPVRRDLALLLDKNITFEQVETIIRDSERRLLRDVQLFDVYEGDKLPEGKKSYAVAMTLQDAEKTLQDKQIEAVMNKIIKNLTTRLNATLR